jgi:beta-lactamase superfamily II metal-dependent hydrolase
LIAWEKTQGGDPDEIYRIGAAQKEKLIQLGFNNIDSLLNANPIDVSLEDLPNIGGIRAKRIRAILQANRSGTPVLPDPNDVPDRKDFEFYVDFEYFNNLNINVKKEWPQLLGHEMIFMIGVGWEEPQGKWNFEPFIAKKENLDQEGEMIEEFIQFLDTKTNGAFKDSDRTALYHWTSAEVTQSRKAARRLNLSQNHPINQLPWVDLQKAFMQTPCGIPGAWGFGLKEVAKGLGKLDTNFDPQWVGDMDDGLGAMVLGWRAYENRRPANCDEMKIIRQYLEADCKALWCILRWMRARDPGLPFDVPGQIYVGWDKVVKGFSKPDTKEAFAALNDGKGVIIYLQPILNKRTGIKKIQHLIWGDWLLLLESQAGWRKVYSRGTTGWIHKSHIQEDRLLEVNFVDVGQGDGCFIVTPDDRYILIDAGMEDHMYRFLRWRFRHFQHPVTFDAAIITHPDKDHYYGFRKFFDREDEAVQNVQFECVYHNGIIERKSGDLGASEKIGDVKYVTEVVTGRSELKRILSSIRGGDFLGTLRKADQCGRVNDIRMLGAGKHEPMYMEGYEKNKELSFEVLAPVPEESNGNLHLRWFKNNAGKTKNGHSITLRLKYKDVYILLGGDLNIPAEEYLLGHYGESIQPYKDLNEEQKEAVIEKAREFFVSDVAKSCHHGSADVSSEFLQTVNAVATVVSSGDDESHCHPRPESLGVLGKYGRGTRPLIKDREIEFIDQLLHNLGRSVAVYGMITLRTDGKHALMAQKLEKQRPNGQKWDLTLLRPGEDGRLHYHSKH